MHKDTQTCEDKSSVENGAKMTRLSDLMDDASRMGCEAALRKHDHNVEYLTDEKRARYLEIVNIRDTEDVLEIGASMGQHTRLIAKQCRHLEALEVVAAQAEFAKLWCQQSGLDNVGFTVGGGDGTLPYDDAAFEVVIMNYVLEWSAGHDASRPDEFHLRLLKEVARVLKPGGRFFVSTKNRYGVRLLLGSVDEHFGFRFGSVLPRWMTYAISKRLSRSAPRGYLHSRNDLKHLLRAAGFSKFDMFLSFPDARRPDVIIPFDRRNLLKLRELDRSRYSRKDRLYLKLPAPLQEQFATSHTFLVTKLD